MARERSEKAAARRAWIADGGTELTFERRWSQSLKDDLRDERVKKAVEEKGRAAREEQRRASRI